MHEWVQDVFNYHDQTNQLVAEMLEANKRMEESASIMDKLNML
jgi:hypothetical protein